MKKIILIWALCFASSSVSLQRAAAQIAPPAATPAASQLAPPAAPTGAFPADLAHNTSARASHPELSQANAAAQQSEESKVVRIYSGAGYFDEALAKKLRPNLAKAFAPAKSAALQPVPGAAVAAGSVPAAPNIESQKKAKGSDHL